MKAFNQQINNGIKPSEAYKNTMSSCSKEAKQQAVAIARGTQTIDAATSSIKKSTLAAKANTIVMSTMSTALNIGVFMLISAGISKLVTFVDELTHSEENLKQVAKELGSELSSNISDIDSYKEKINDLKSTINDSSSSYDEVTQARVDLMKIQDELIDKFGTEKNVIENITGAINDQADALDNLSRKSYYEAKNKFNEKTNGDSFVDWLIWGNTNADDVQSNMDKMIRQMQHSIYSLKTTGNDALDEYISKSYELNIFDDIYGDGKHFNISGNLDEIQEKLYGIQEIYKNFNVSTEFENSFTEISNDVDSLLKSNQELYNQYILWEKILTNKPNNQYDEQYNLINKAKEVYNNAIKTGDETNISYASEEYSKILSSAIKLAYKNGDIDVADYFENMYPEMQQIFSEWKFELNFNPNTGGLKDSISNALNNLKDFSSEDLLNFSFDTSTQDQISAYAELNNVANEYGLTLQQLINLLLQMGLVQSESYQQLVEKFGKDNIEKLSPEELTFAYQIKNVGNMSFDELQAEIQKLKDTTSQQLSKSFKDFWSSIGNTEKATDLKEELFKLASSGELTGSKLKSLAKDNELLKSAMDSTGLSANKLAEKIRELNIGNIESDIKSFADALDKVKNKQSLTTEETAKLIAKDNSLAGAVKKTKDGYLLEKDALEKVVNSHKEKYNVAVSYEINETKKVIDRIKDRIDAYQKEIDALKEVSKARDDLGGTKSGSYSDTLAQLELEKKLEKDQKKYDKRQKKLKELMNSLNNIDTSSTSNSSDSNSKSSKVFDYIQIKIARLERLHSKYLDKASDGTKTLTERTKNYNKVLSITEKQINAQDKAIVRYNKQLKKIGLDESIAKKIRDGAFDIDTLKGKKKDKAEKYQDIWEKILDGRDKKADLKASIPETERNMYQAELDDLENKRKAEEAISDELKNQIELKEKIGDKNTSSDYSAVNESILKQINNYKKQIPVLEKQLGTVKKGSDKWYEYKEAIDSVKDSISSLTQEMMDNATKGIEAIQNASDEYLKSLDDEDTLNNAEKENALTADEKNSYIQNTIDNIGKRKDKYTQDSLDYLNEKNNSANLIKSTSKKVRKSQGAVFDSILSFVNSGQKIPEDILNQVTDANLLTNCYAYNSAITAYETNEATRKLYNETSKSDIRNAVIDKVNNINDEYDVKNATLDREEVNIQQDIAEKEANGVGKSVKDYRKLIEIDEQRKKNAIDRRSKLEELLNTEIELGHIVKNENEPAYKAFMSSIASCDEEISNCTVSQINYNKAIREMNVENYKTAISLLDSMIDKYKRLQSLADVHNSKLSDKDILAQIGLNDEKIAENNKYLSIIKDNIRTYLTDELHMSAENVEEFINLMENSPYKLRGFMNDLGFKDFNEKTFPDLNNNLNEFNSTMNENTALMVEQENQLDSLAQKRIDTLNEYLETLKKQKDYKDRIFAIEKAQYDLEKAKNNLTKKVWDGQQWVYTADTEAVQSAQETLDNAKFEEFNNSIQDLIEVLEQFIKDFNIYDDNGNMINNPEVILKKGVLGEYTIVDIDKIFTDKVLDTSKLSGLMSNIQYAMPNVSIPNINLPDIQSRAMNQTVNYDKIELILPNITDASTGADLAKSFVNELKNLPSYAKQYDWNR